MYLTVNHLRRRFFRKSWRISIHAGAIKPMTCVKKRTNPKIARWIRLSLKIRHLGRINRDDYVMTHHVISIRSDLQHAQARQDAVIRGRLSQTNFRHFRNRRLQDVLLTDTRDNNHPIPQRCCSCPVSWRALPACNTAMHRNSRKGSHPAARAPA